MEEEIQIIIDNIWETNIDSEELLIQKLYKLSFSTLLNKDQKSKKIIFFIFILL
jgi:hypothetical protein